MELTTFQVGGEDNRPHVYLNKTYVHQTSSQITFCQVKDELFLLNLARFIFCEATLTLHAPTFNKKEYLPECIPCLPETVWSMNATSQMAIMQIANIFGATNRFIFSEGIVLPESRYAGEVPISSS